MDTREVDGHMGTRDILYIEMWTDYDLSFSEEHLDSIRKFRYSYDIDIRNHRCFCYIRDREKYPFHTHLTGEDRRRKGSLDTSYIPIERELPEK